jgi:hypothetical protein
MSYQLVYRPRQYRSPLALDFLQFLRCWSAGQQRTATAGNVHTAAP